MTEAQLEKKCLDWSRSHGWIAYKFVSPTTRGVPDRLFIKDGKIIFIEFKSKHHGRVRPWQAHQIQRMKDHGAIVHIVNDYEQFTTLMSEVSHDG